MLRGLRVILLTLVVSASGCLSGGNVSDALGDPSPEEPSEPDDAQTTEPARDEPPTSPRPSPRPTPRPSPKPSSSPSPEPEPEPEPEPAPDPAPQTEQPAWPPISSATIRPGVQVTSSGGQCTSNFIFRSPDNATLYIGIAAHCVNAMEYGSPLTIEGASQKGSLAYSSWQAKGLASCPGPTTCGAAYYEDFALVQIDEADRGRVHPAMLYFGGPIGLKDAKSLVLGERLLTYGDSSLRFGISALSPHEGVVIFPESSSGTFTMYTHIPGVPGDSGSGVMTRKGEATGVLVHLQNVPPLSNGAAGLVRNLNLASSVGFEAELCTWQLIDDGLIP